MVVVLARAALVLERSLGTRLGRLGRRDDGGASLGPISLSWQVSQAFVLDGLHGPITSRTP